MSATVNTKWMETMMSRFNKYLDLELQVLRAEGVTYYIAYEFLEAMLKRIELFVKENTASENVPEAILEQNRQERIMYLAQVRQAIEHCARQWDYLDGSMWEDVRRRLEGLAQQVPTFHHVSR